MYVPCTNSHTIGKIYIFRLFIIYKGWLVISVKTCETNCKVFVIKCWIEKSLTLILLF